MNKETLTLKELAPYLPYDLKCYWGRGKRKVSISKPIERYLFLINQKSDLAEGVLENIKPCLRNLSQLTQEIEHNGERFVPARRIGFGMNHKAEINKDYLLQMSRFKDIYSAYEKLFEWHFDVFGLIPRSLALEIKE